MSFDPANLPTKTPTAACDWLAERDREHRERHGTPLLVERTGPPPSVEDMTADFAVGESDRTPPTVVPAVVDELGGWPVVTPALRPGLL